MAYNAIGTWCLRAPDPLRLDVSLSAQPSAMLSALLRVFLGWCFLCALTQSCLASAFEGKVTSGQQITAQGLWVDESQKATIEDATLQNYIPLAGAKSRGFTPTASWLRLEIAPGTRPLAVSVQPPYLDNVQLYRPNTGGALQNSAPAGWDMLQAGDGFAHAKRERSDLPSSFNLTPHPTQSITVYVRIQTLGTHIFYALAEPVDVLKQKQDRQILLIGMYCGTVFLLLILSIFFLFARRDHMWAIGALLQLCSLLYIPAVTGFLSKFLLPNQPFWADALTYHSGLLQNFTAGLFFWYYFRSLNASNWVTLVLRVSLWLYPVMLVLLLLGFVPLATGMNNLTYLAKSAWGIGSIWFVLIADTFSRRVVRTIYVLLCVWSVALFAPVFGIVPLAPSDVSPPWFGNLGLVIMQFILLTRREVLLGRETALVAQRLELKAQEFEMGRKQREASSNFMAMLLHELKNPLASIRLAAYNLLGPSATPSEQQQARLANIEKSVDNIDMVLERCRQADQIEQGRVVLTESLLDVAEVLRTELSRHPQAARIAAQIPGKLAVQADEFLWRIIYSNLIDNALNYSPPGSLIQVNLNQKQRAGQSVFELSVSNAISAVGAPDETQVFQKYYRSPNASKLSGSGLGLHLVKNFAQLCGGDVVYEPSSADVKFTVWLPNQ
jgi:two-component system, sensor histidine kinase LadS